LQILKNYITLRTTRFIRSKLTALSIIDGAFLLIGVEKEILKKYHHAELSCGEEDKSWTLSRRIWERLAQSVFLHIKKAKW